MGLFRSNEYHHRLCIDSITRQRTLGYSNKQGPQSGHPKLLCQSIIVCIANSLPSYNKLTQMHRVIIAIICQLVYSRGVYTSLDLTYDVWKTTLCAQFVQNLSVVATSIPYLKPFYMGLESGLIRNDDLRRLGPPSEYGYGPAMWVKAGSKTSGKNTQTSERTQPERHDPGALPYSTRPELHTSYSESKPAGSLRSSEGDTTSQSRIVVT